MKQLPCSECGKPMPVNEGMEAMAEQVQEAKPGSDVGFICQTCERGMVGAKAFEAQQRAHRRWN